MRTASITAAVRRPVLNAVASSPSPRAAVSVPRFTRSAWGTSAPAPPPVKLAYDLVHPKEDKRPDEALVVCHGFLGSKQNWRSLGKRMANALSMRVFTLDMRNHGQSPHAAPHTSVAMAEDLGLFFKDHGLTSGVHLVGHSMGAKSVMAYALNADLNAPLRSLVPIDMTPNIEPIEPQYNGYTKGMQEIAAAKVQTRVEADELLKPYEAVPATRQFLLTNAITVRGPYGRKHVGFRVNLPLLADAINRLGEFPYTPPPPVSPTSPQWTGPVLFIKGAHAAYIRPDNIEVARRFFPRMELVTLDAGHWVHADRPDETVESIVRFVQNN